MSEHSNHGLPEATVVRHKRLRLSVVWLIPLLAAVLALGILIERLTAQGPTIKITFSAGEGIEAGKTVLKYRDVTVGQVTAVHFAEDFHKVEVTAKIAKSASGLMVEGTRFWVVAPHISITGISGISTLLSGNFIELSPGTGKQAERSFIGLDQQPRITDQAGRRFILSAPELGSLSIGAPLYFRQLPVGEVESYELAKDGQAVTVTVFVRSPYDAQVHAETRFWNASGVDVSLGEAGINVHTASLLALLAGGVSFDTPSFFMQTPPASDGATFKVHPDRATAMKQPEAYARRYVLYFNDSVRGLSVGAPVTLMGLTVGEVTDIGLSFDETTLAVRPRVFVSFYPELAASKFSGKQRDAVLSNTQQDNERHIRVIRRLVEERGLRARLRSSSLITGQQYVAFEFLPGAPKSHLDWGHEPLELPVARGEIAELESTLASILGKIDRMPLAKIGTEAAGSLEALHKTLGDADVLLKDVDAKTVPQIGVALADVHRALESANATLLGPDAPNQQALHEALEQLSRSARSLRQLTDYLERHPEALLRGKSEEKP